jgi:predicted outer membrane repeat protein
MASSIFNKNIALGLGGGAIYMSHSVLEMQHLHGQSCTFTDNTAPHGGGGALLWSGDMAPNLIISNNLKSPFTLSDHTRWLCDRNNTASYGPCVATVYNRLELQGLPTHQRPGYAGVPLELVVLKLDAYGQTITSDSSSSLQVYSAFAGTKVNDDSVAFLGSILSGFQRGRAVFSIGVKPTFVSVSVADGRTELEHPPYLYFKGTDLTTARIMETNPQQVHLSSGNRTVCPVGAALMLEPSVGSETVMTDPRPGTCKVCDSGFYNVNPLTGRCLACPPLTMCINGEALFGARKVAGTVEVKLPDDGDDGVLQALADKLGVKAWQVTVLSQQPRRHSTRAAMRGAGPTTLATAQRRRTITVSFELVADEAQMEKLAVSLPALGVKLGEIKPIGPQIAAGEVWEEINGVYMLRKCPPGFKIISTPIEMQKCSPCGKGKYIIEGSTDCVDCPVFSPATPPGCILPLCLLHTHLLSHSPRTEPTAPTVPNSSPK